MKEDEKYPKAFKIPSREEFAEFSNHIDSDNDNDIAVSKEDELPDFDSFVEIDMSEPPIQLTELHPGLFKASELIERRDPAEEEIRAVFYSMRQLARDSFSFNSNEAKTFRAQALYMEYFEDDYSELIPFSSYFPSYQQMRYDQLRTYFTWRSRVRKGDIQKISLSYAFVYIYELLHNIGVKTPSEGLAAILYFWKSFRELDAAIDKYVLMWLKDYHVYYPDMQPFEEFAEENNLKAYYPMVFCYSSDEENSLDIFCEISSYNIKGSLFYTEENKEKLKKCFYFVITRFREAFLAKRRLFEDIVFRRISREAVWAPFGNALFHPALKQPDREVVLSKRESYRCKDNKWGYKTVILSDNGRKTVGYIMKETEAVLRQETGFKRKLSASPAVCGEEAQDAFDQVGISLAEFIRTAVADYIAAAGRKEVRIDVRNLVQIRTEALMTQEKLIVEEAPLADEGSAKADRVSSGDTEEVDNSSDDVPVKEDVLINTPLDEWDRLIISLSPIELEAVSLVLNLGDIRGFAMKNHTMPEVLIDGINEKAFDCIGDTIMELGAGAEIFEDYRDYLLQKLKAGGQQENII